VPAWVPTKRKAGAGHGDAAGAVVPRKAYGAVLGQVDHDGAGNAVVAARELDGPALVHGPLHRVGVVGPAVALGAEGGDASGAGRGGLGRARLVGGEPGAGGQRAE